MPLWWGKSSSKEEKRKGHKDCIIDAIQRTLNKSRWSRRHRSATISQKGSISLVPSRSQSPTAHVYRCQSFGEGPLAQPLPLPLPPQPPKTHPPTANHANYGTRVTPKLENTRGSQSSLYLPLPKPGCVSNKGEPAYAEEDVVTASVSSGSSIDSDDQCDSRFLSPLASDCENGNQAIIHSSVSVLQKDQSLITTQKNSRVSSKPTPQLRNHQLPSNTPKGAPKLLPNLQLACPGGLWSAPGSSISSPSRSPLRTFGSEQVLNSGLCTGNPYPDITSGHCSSPGSGHNSVGGDLTGQMFWPQSRCSPEYSPIPSPGMTSPGFSSRIHSEAVSPLHPRAGGTTTESPTSHPDDVKQQTRRLALPSITIPNSSLLSTITLPSAPQSPGVAENLTSPGSRWKKGQLIGRGTFGHVYLGFNCDSGEMCAMKEVTLFADDAKSRESAKQLGQEIALLSCLRHPNIVQYYGSETVDDKLYIYLEYISGGSIYKLLQQYGQLGEIAIRNYTRQIVLGLAYLHAKNTVHRDIKGANILVDPNGRVKLADFGMAKHISGQSCPLSSKGSPYWMAPEVIKNSGGCNLAVDIWSLGCTVLEMATTKPPWSQYEGVAAMFKIGNSKELPEIPDHLSEDGKDFVRQCLQRNPQRRPSAAQLLLHPFVKRATLERPILSADPFEANPAFVNAMRSLAIGPAKHNLASVSEAAGAYLSGLSDAHTPRDISHPVSPTGSPLLPSSSRHASGRLSPSPISSPHTASGSSTPLTSGIGAVPFHQTKQPTFSYEGVNVIQRPQNARYQEPNHDPLRGIMRDTFAYPDIVSSNNDCLGYNRRVVQGSPREFYDGDLQQVLNDRARSNFGPRS